MDHFSKDGRKLRPRKQRVTNSAEPAYSTEGKENGERKPYHRSFSGNRGQYGRSGGYGRSEGGYGRQEGEGEHRPYRSSAYGQHRSTGEHRPYGDKRASSHGSGSFHGKGEGGYGRQGAPRRQEGARPQYGRKPAYGKKPAAPKGPLFNKENEEGINRMIEKSPKPYANVSDFDSYQSPIQEEVRLNKFIANSGVCSRREADTMIQAGVVTVNGEVVTELGTKVNVLKDEVRFNGETLRGEAKVYLVMNKPKGFVTTASDPHAEKTVMDLIKACPSRVYPVGRLDKATTGVLMFTNDGEIAERLTHPSYDKKKIYQVILNKPLTEESREKILSGIELQDGEISADALEYIDTEDHRKLGIEIHSGKNRIVRRIFESQGYEVRALDRVYFAGLTKKGLKKGEWRYLSEGEVNILKMGAYV